MCGLGLSVLTGCSGEPPARPNVLLVTLDTTRADALGAYGGPDGLTPHLDGLAARGLVVAEAMSVGPLTAPAHASMMTGRYPFRHGLRNNGAYALDAAVPTLAEAFSAAGYRTGAFVSAAVLTEGVGLARGFDHYADDLPDPSHDREQARQVPQLDGATVVADATAWVGRHMGETPEQPLFLWVHLYDAHQPHTPDARFLDRTTDPYLAEVAELDEHVGALLQTLESLAPGAPWLVSALGDHGEAFGEHGEEGHGFFVYRSTLRVPWLLAGPGVPAGARLAAPASQVDLAETLTTLAGVPWADGDDGLDLMGLWAEPESAPPRTLYGETLAPLESYGLSPLFVLQHAEDRVILAPRSERYRWRTDPTERDDLGLDAVSRRASDAWVARHPGAAEAPTQAGDSAALAAIGYMAGQPGGLHARLDLDPKDHAGLPQRVAATIDRAHRMPSSEGAALLQQAIDAQTGVLQLRQELAQAWEAAGDAERTDRALADLEAAGETAHTRTRRATRLLRQGDVAGARAILEAELDAQDPSQELRVLLGAARHLDGDTEAGLAVLRDGAVPSRSVRYHTLEGALLSALGRPREAVAPLRRALALDPTHLDAMEALAPVLFDLGWSAEAEALCQRAWTLDATATWPAVLLARVGFSTGGCPAAAPYVEAVGPGASQEPDLAPVFEVCGG